MTEVSRRIVLHFPQRLVDQPIVYRLIKDYNLIMNILKAYVTPDEEGLMVLELQGREKDYQKGIQYLAEVGVKVEPLSQDVKRNEERCTHCGACVTICSVGALVVEPVSYWIEFYHTKCIACGLCVKACPVKAMEVHF